MFERDLGDVEEMDGQNNNFSKADAKMKCLSCPNSAK